ncbi:hypothetical protein OO184_06925 [Photorhabdus sp. APURE]|nr:hypothetical protein [Photorhabdus aballayi]MCW7547673.1 hypothetical protein [Photorhabdus aballayi]
MAERLGVDTYSLLKYMAARVPADAYGIMQLFPLLTFPIKKR